MTRPPVLLIAAAASLAVAVPASAGGPAGAIAQLAGSTGCITETGASNGVAAQCGDGRGLGGAEAIAVSPDGRFVYSYSYDSGAIAILSRDPASGILAQADATSACIGPTDVAGTCTSDGRFPGAQSDSGHAIAISPDGSLLFAAGHGVSVFHRDAASGALTPGVCVSADGTDAASGNTCAPFAGIGAPQALAVSPDGRFLYAGGYDAHGLAILAIGPTGDLAPLAAPDGCVTTAVDPSCTTARDAEQIYDIALAPDGHTLYAVAQGDNAVVGFARDAGTGKLTEIAGPAGCVDITGTGSDPCTLGHGLLQVNSVTVSPDGTLLALGNAPGGSSGAVIVLHRDPATGALSQSAGAAGCVNVDTSDGCGTSRVTTDVYETAFTTDGRALFTAAYGNGVTGKSGIAVFDVGADGALTQRAGAAGCFTDTGADNNGTAGACTAARGILGPVGMMLSPHGESLYSSVYDDSGVASFSIQVAPVCAGTPASTPFETAVAIPVACTDANGDTVSLAGVDSPTHGTVTFSGLTATYTPAAGFSGDDSFRVKGNDGSNDSAPATETVHVAAAPPVVKRAPLKLSLSAKPKRDKKLPFKYTFSGKLTPAAGAACSGKVVLTVRHGRKTAARKTAKLSSSCRYKAVVKLANRKKLGRKHHGKLVARARFGGNAVMTAKSSKSLTVRYG